MKLRVYDGKTIRYQSNNDVWQLCIDPVHNQFAISIPTDSGDITTTHIMRYVTKVLYRPNNQTPYSYLDLYENDIVEVRFLKGLKTSNEEEITKIGRVVWCEDSGAFKIEWNYNKNQHHLFLNDCWTSIKVIGNTFENPNIELSYGNCWE